MHDEQARVVMDDLPSPDISAERIPVGMMIKEYPTSTRSTVVALPTAVMGMMSP